MNPLDRVRKAHIAIMNHKEFCAFSGVVACGSTTITSDVPTAATDGWNVKYNPDFIESHLKDDKHLRFVVLHENMHKAYRHLHVWRALHKEDAQLANIAADTFINTALVDADPEGKFIAMPDVGIKPDPECRGMSVKQIFDKLKQDGEGSGGGDSFDDHDWENAQGESEQTTQERADEIGRALRQGELIREKRQGSGSGGLNRLLDAAMQPKVDWRQVLRDFISETCRGYDEYTWRRPNRRFLAHDLLMPGTFSEVMSELVIGFDTSGSTWFSDDMEKFVAEIGRIVADIKPKLVRVVYWDTEVTGSQTFEDGQFAVANMKPKGGGGTDGSVLFDWLRDNKIKPDAIVNFTDGYVGSWGQSDVPTLWAITGDRKAPWGTTVNIE